MRKNSEKITLRFTASFEPPTIHTHVSTRQINHC